MERNSFNRAVLYAPSDTVDILDQEFQAIYVGGAGNLVIVWKDGSTSLFTAVLAGTIYYLRGFKRINATSTTATAIQLLYGV